MVSYEVEVVRPVFRFWHCDLLPRLIGNLFLFLDVSWKLSSGETG